MRTTWRCAAAALLVATTLAAAAPAEHHDEVLGRLVLDDSARYAGKARWRDADVEVIVAAAQPDALTGAVATAHALWEDAEHWDVRARGVAADQLLPTRVTDAESARAAFIAHIELRRIIVFAEGDFELWYDDAGLLGGRSISVAGSIVDGPQSAELAR